MVYKYMVSICDISSLFMGRGGAVVSSVLCYRRVAGSNPTLAAAYGPWASPSLVIARGTSAC